MSPLEKSLKNVITEIIAEWHKSPEGEILSFEEYIEIVLENKTTFKIGSEGEDFVASLAKSKNYIVIPSPGSRSPSDLWCLSNNDNIGCFHLALIQVKNTEELSKPEILDDKMILKFRQFSSFVLRYWAQTSFIKEYPKYSNIMISTGYAGVISETALRKLFNPRYYNFWYPKNLESNLWRFKDHVENFHYLR